MSPMTSSAEHSAPQNAAVPGSSGSSIASLDSRTSIDGSKRIDFLPLFNQHSDELSSLAFNVRQELMLMGRSPSCYLNESSAGDDLKKKNTGDDRYAFIDALLQARGGGVVLALLSDDFFDDPLCVARFVAARELNRVAPWGAKLKLRFIGGESEKRAVRESVVAADMFPDLFAEYDVKDCDSRSFPEMVAAVAKVVANAWDGHDGEKLTILGATAREAFSQLLALLRFEEDDAKLLSGKFELDVRPENDIILEAFKLKMNARDVDLSDNDKFSENMTDIDKLGDIAFASMTYSTYVRFEAIHSYSERWLDSQKWDWRKATRDKFAGYVRDAKILINQSRRSAQVPSQRRSGRSKNQLRRNKTNSTSQPAGKQAAWPRLIDSEIRYDLVTLHAWSNTKIHTIADHVGSLVAQIGKKRCKFPSLFNQDMNMVEGHLRIFEAIMQARGGGVVLVLLSIDFFSDQWCLTVLLVILMVQKSAVPAERLKLRFACLEDDFDDIRTKYLDPFPLQFGDCDLQPIGTSTDLEMARRLAHDVWIDLDGRGSDKRETALGGSARQAVFRIRQIFSLSDKLIGTSQTGHPELVRDQALIADAAVLKGVINLKNFNNLEEIVRKNISVPQLWRLHVLNAYRQRWEESRTWNWTIEKLDSLVADALSVTEKLQSYYEQEANWTPSENVSLIDMESWNAIPPKPSTTYVHGMDDPKSADHRIKGELLSSAFGVRIVVTGPSGSGKSEACMGVLADEEVRDRFSDGVFWLQLNRAEKKDRVMDVIATLVATLYRRSKTNQRYAIETLLSAKGKGINCARRLISESSAVGRRFLLVIDDAWSSEIVDTVLYVLPEEASVVITTCLPKVIATITRVRINMGRMSDRAAEKLLEKLMGRTKPFSDSERKEFVSPILTETWQLPLGIVIVGSMLAEANGEWKHIVNLLRRKGLVNDQFAMPSGPRYACQKGHETVGAALQSWVKYIDDTTSFLAFLELGILPVNSFIQEEVLAKLWGINDVTEIVRALGDVGLVQVTEVAGMVRGIELDSVVGAYALAELRKRAQEVAVHQKLIEAYRRENHFTGQDEESGLDWFPLWKIPIDGYFHDNIGRHAVGAQDVSVARYIVDPMWRKARDRETPGAWLDADVEFAIRTLEAACRVPRTKNPEKRGWVCVFTGVAYYKRGKGNRRENIEGCISFLCQGLRLCDQDASPNLFAALSYALGDAYMKRIEGQMVYNMEEAIMHYKNALLTYTRDASPKRWGETMYKMMIVEYDAGFADAALETAMKLEASYADARDSTQDENCQGFEDEDGPDLRRVITSSIIAADGKRLGFSLGASRVSGLPSSCTIS